MLFYEAASQKLVVAGKDGRRALWFDARKMTEPS
jgi:hypothetical protein